MCDNEQAIKAERNTGVPYEHKMSIRINLQPSGRDNSADATDSARSTSSTRLETGSYSIIPLNPPDNSPPTESNYAVCPRDDSDYLEIKITSNPPKVSSTIFCTTLEVIFSNFCDLVLHPTRRWYYQELHYQGRLSGASDSS